MQAPDSIVDTERERDFEAICRLHPLARSRAEWELWFQQQGAPKYRGSQLFGWLHQKGELDPSRMTNLDKGTRTQLLEAGLQLPLRVDSVRRSGDGTRKLLLRLHDERLVECVLIPMTQEGDADVAAVDAEDDEEDNVDIVETKKRVTLCVSTQVGCAMACAFCASGQAGLKRGLVAAEVIAQVLLAKRYLDPDEQLRNLVFMGMGEPLHHYNETRRAIEIITDPHGVALSRRRVTVSTVGLVSGIKKLGQDFDGKVGLAVSLHAPDDETRSRIMPVNRRYPIAELIKALHEYPLPKRRRMTIEYTLMQGVNDSREHARKLAKLLNGLRVKVNLIPMNAISNSDLGAPDNAIVDAFKTELARLRVSCSVRKRRGDDVDAACGQLALMSQPDTVLKANRLVRTEPASASQAPVVQEPER